jgi:hypothetical protein
MFVKTTVYNTNHLSHLSKMDENTRVQIHVNRPKSEDYCLKQRSMSPEQHLISECAFFSKRINQLLHPFEEELRNYLPLDEQSLLSSLRDGVIIAYLIHSIRPNVIDLTKLLRDIDFGLMNQPYSRLTFEISGNHDIVFEAAKSLGIKLVNIGSQDLLEMRPSLVLGLIWQLIRLSFADRINLNRYPELAMLISDNYSIPSTTKQSLESLLLLWLNLHLRNCKSPTSLDNLTTSLCDSVAYAYLLTQIVPRSLMSEEEGDGLIERISSLDTDINGLEMRAEILIEKLRTIGIDMFLSPQEIVSGNMRVNVCLVAELFNRFSMPQTTAGEIQPSETHIELEDRIQELERLVLESSERETEIKTKCDVLIQKLEIDHENYILVLKKEHQDEIRELRIGYEKEIKTLRSIYEDKIELLESRHRMDIETLNSINQARADDTKLNEARIIEIKNMHESEVQRLRIDQETKIGGLVGYYNDLASKYRSTIDDVKQDHQQMIKSVCQIILRISMKLDRSRTVNSKENIPINDRDRVHEIDTLKTSHISSKYIDQIVHNLENQVNSVLEIHSQAINRIHALEQERCERRSHKRSVFYNLRKKLGRILS